MAHVLRLRLSPAVGSYIAVALAYHGSELGLLWLAPLSALLPSLALSLVRTILANTDFMATAEEAECAYIYGTLEEPDKSIRLLKILSTTPRITCTFKAAYLKDSPVFSALSYVWGNATITEPVTVEGKTLHITVNLAGAIQDVHRQWSAGELLAPGKEQWLWADALCINQNDAQEKNHQVPLMDKIYSNAHRVISWLGGWSDERASNAVDAYHVILDAIRQLPGYNVIRDRAQNGSQYTGSTEDILAELGDILLDAITDCTWLGKHYDTQPDQMNILFHAALLFSLPYWTRLWILQEIVLARDAILLCGSKHISWLEVCGVQTWVSLFQMKHSFIDLPPSVPADEWAALKMHGVSGAYGRVRDLKSYGSMRNTRPKYTSVPPTNASKEATTKAHFITTVDRFIMSEHALPYQATDAKDYVYAIGGVTGLRIPADYSSGKTVAQVYWEYTVRWLDALAWGDASEGFPDHRIMCDLWFLTYAGVGFLWTPIPGLPSWVPNLKGVAEAKFSQEGEKTPPSFRRHLGNFDESGSFPRGSQRATFLDSCLFCSAVVVEESINIGPTVYPYKSFESHSFEEDEWLLWIYDFMAARKGKLDHIVAALKSLDDEFASLDPIDGRQLLIADLEYVCRKRKAIPRTVFYPSIGFPLPPGKTPKDSYTMDERRLSHLGELHRQLGSDSERRHHLKIAASVILYMRALRSWHKFRLTCTSEGLFGIFPPQTEDGDMICVLKGYTLPVVLRRHGDDYQFVGACSIPGLTKEDVGGRIRDGRAPVKRIRIY